MTAVRFSTVLTRTNFSTFLNTSDQDLHHYLLHKHQYACIRMRASDIDMHPHQLLLVALLAASPILGYPNDEASRVLALLGPAPAPTLGTPGLTHAVHVVADLSTPSDEHLVFNAEAGPATVPPTNRTNIYFNEPRTDQYIEYCKVPQEPKDKLGLPPRLIHQEDYNQTIGPFSDSDVGNDCRYDSTVGQYGVFRCDKSTNPKHPTGVLCSGPSADMKKTTCNGGNNAKDDLTPLALCLW